MTEMGRYLDVSVQPARKVRGKKLCESKSSTVLYKLCDSPGFCLVLAVS